MTMSFETFVLRHTGLVRSIALRILRQRDDADDAVQRTWLRAWKAWQTNAPHNPTAWIGTIAEREALQMLRELRGRHKQRPTAGPLVHDLADDSAQEGFESACRSELMELLDRLPPLQRRAVELFYFEGRSYDEISIELKMKRGSLGRLLSVARQFLRDLLDG